MNQKTDTKYVYSVLFWAIPKSGFDVIKKNSIMDLFKDIAGNSPANDPHLKDKLQRFEADNDGMVLYDEVIESDTSVMDPEVEVMPTIRDRYPEAKYIVILPMIFGE